MYQVRLDLAPIPRRANLSVPSFRHLLSTQECDGPACGLASLHEWDVLDLRLLTALSGVDQGVVHAPFDVGRQLRALAALPTHGLNPEPWA